MKKKKRDKKPDTGSKKPSFDDFEKISIAKAGILADIARAFGVSRRTVYNWIEDDADFKKVIADAKEHILDIAENRIITLLKGIPRIITDENGEKRVAGWEQEPDRTMLIYYTKTQGKHRGFVERSEVEHDAGGQFLDFLKQTAQK